MKILLLVLVAVAAASETPIVKVYNLSVNKGQTIAIESPGYPKIPPAGTRITWYITGSTGTNILLTCEDLRISPSPNCEKGYFLVFDSVREDKFCGSESGLTVRSPVNQMKLEFDLNWSSGVAKCEVKGVEPDEGAKNPDVSDAGEIELLPAGPAYDKIYATSINRYTDKKWRFTTTPGSRISLHCSEIVLSGRCEQSVLDLTDGTDKDKVCDTKYGYNKVFRTNSLTIKLKTTEWYRGRINCLVQAVTGDKPFQYRNIISREVDSSEYGRRPGPRKTDCQCGWTAKSPARIVNGQEVADGQYPWMASLNYMGYHICGGSIITQYHILTAAHCTEKREAHNFKVYLGTTNNTHAANGQTKQVKQIISHEYIRGSLHLNDIAIMLLEDKIQFNSRIGPVCLTPNRVPLDHMFITVMGWGALGKEGGWVNPDQLMRAHMRVVDHNTCSYLWYRNFDTSAPDRVCTWASNRDSCFGDSGGPLVWLDPQTNRYTQIGLVSFGRGCNTDYPKVNTNVAHYYNWIQNIIKDTKPEMKTCKKM